MMDSSYTSGFIAGQNSNNRNDGMWGGDGGWWAWILLFAIFGWGNGGFGGWGGGNSALQGALTRSDLCAEFNANDLQNAVRGVQQGICDSTFALNNTVVNGFGNVARDMCTGFANVAAGITENRFAAQQCCCETNRNIDAVRYENARNTCDIITAGQANTQRIIDAMTQDKLDTLRDQLQAANFQLSQQAQNAYLVNQLRPCPIPAYLSCSPYQTYGFGPYSGGNNCGCGCNSGCGC